MLLEDVHPVQNPAAETGTERHAVDPVALADGRDERVDHVVEHRVTGEVDDRLGRVESLQQRARVVEEHVGHLVRRQSGLDDVVAVGAAGPLLDVERDVGVQLGEGRRQALGQQHRRLGVVDQQRQRHVLAAGQLDGAVIGWRGRVR